MKHSWSPNLGLHCDTCPFYLPITPLDHFLYPTQAPLPLRQILIMYHNNLSILDNIRYLPLFQQCIVQFPQISQILLPPSIPELLCDGQQMFELAIQAARQPIRIWIIKVISGTVRQWDHCRSLPDHTKVLSVRDSMVPPHLHLIHRSRALSWELLLLQWPQ